MNYQKAYMNQIFSSSLMGQVAEMWRNQLLCDAIIRTGSTDTKAHRLVLVAACPMLQTMENATVGSHLEVRLSAEIKPESVQTFLKYLYEGFMMLTGDNYKDIEKIAKILQVESVVRCCTDFSKCLSEKTGVPCEKRFSMNESPESVYVRSSDLLKVHDSVKRHSEGDTVSPEGERKRQKMNRPTPPPPLLLPMHNIANSERVLQTMDMSRSSDTDRSVGMIETDYSQGIQTSRSSASEVEMMKDSIEIVHREAPDPNNINQSEPPIQQTMALSVASRVSSDRNAQLINMTNILPHSRSSSAQNLHILSSPHSSSSRKPEAAHSSDSEPRTPETHKNHDRRHLLTGDSHSRYQQRPSSHELAHRKHDSYPSNLPSSEILGSTLHDLSAKSISSPSISSPQPSSPYRPPISFPHRQPTSSQVQKSFIQPMFRPGIPFDGRPFAGVPIGSLRHMAGGLLPTSLAPPLHISYNMEDSSKDHGSSSSVPNSPCTPSVPDLSIIKSEERENEELHIDIPEESASGTTTPHNNTEEEPPGDDSSNAGSEGGSLWQDNSVKGKDGSLTNGPNAVISMLDYSLNEYGFGEKTCSLHADNCTAQFSHDKYQLWEFIRDLLHDPKYNPSIIQWENIMDGVFRIVDSAEVARLWGRTKKFTKMTYDHMGRAFRYSKTMGYFAELPKGAGYPKKLCFKFGPKAHNWLPFPNMESPLNLVLKPKIESRRKITERRPNDSVLEKSSGFMKPDENKPEKFLQKTSRKSGERAMSGMFSGKHRFGGKPLDFGSRDLIFNVPSGNDGKLFTSERQLDVPYNIPNIIEKSEEASPDLLERPNFRDQYQDRRHSVEDAGQESDRLLLLARASVAESAATSPRTSSEKQNTPDYNDQT